MDTPKLVIACRFCDERLTLEPGPLPDRCPKCRADASWVTPAPYQLTDQDRRFLKTNKISDA